MGKKEEDGYVGGGLFESRRIEVCYIYCYRLFAASILVGIVSVWVYRLIHFPTLIHGHGMRLKFFWWTGMFAAEVWFGLYWVLTQSARWNPIFRRTFKHRLSRRYEKELPGVDIFVCTADPTVEPPIMVINTVLSVMAYDYPPEKLSVYLSDDGGSELTFYALLEASLFSKHWITYCKKYRVEPRSPAAYFTTSHHSADPFDVNYSQDLAYIKKLYEDLKNRIESATELGRIPEVVRLQYKGFSRWDSFSSPRDHDTILQILIDGTNRKANDIEGCTLPSLVYLAREKRPQHPHNFKAGAMNALIRVSSKMSNGPIILNVDCDMYSNNSQSVRDALCFFMDEQKGHEFAYVQFPQNFENVSNNDVYASSLRIISEVDFHGLDGLGGPLYVGTGCFHRRDTLCGRVFSKDQIRSEWKRGSDHRTTENTAYELEETLKDLASCTFEKNTQWGNEMGLKYGCPVKVLVLSMATAFSSSYSTGALRRAMPAPKTLEGHGEFMCTNSKIFMQSIQTKSITISTDITYLRNKVRCRAIDVDYSPSFLAGNKFQLDDVLEAQQFDRDTLSAIFEVARKMEKIEINSPGSQILKGYLMATLFYEPSTRTRLSFESAMKRLGGEVLTTENACEFSSAAKGETLEDTIRTVEGYSDIIVMRHFESGAAKRAANTANIPVVNAGDGPGQHPTQALLDVYTIEREVGKLDGINVGLVGDLANGRTVRSLAYLLSKYKNVKIYFVSPEVVKMKDDIKEYLTSKGVEWVESFDLMDVASKCDVVYQTRIQRERFGERADLYQEARGKYIVDRDVLGVMQKHAVIMHPLPRLDEITVDVDVDPRAAYFRQAKNGLYIRMALLKLLLVGW